MKRINRITLLLRQCARYLSLLLFCLPALYSCSTNVAGGSEIGNPVIVTGTITTDGITPAEDARVLLIPSGYNPVEDDSVPDYVADTTDERGEFRFTGIDSGMYTLFATDLRHGTRVMVFNVAVTADSVTLNPAVLLPTGTIQVNFSTQQIDTVSGYVFIAGTPLKSRVGSTDKLFLDSVPVGSIPAIEYMVQGDMQSIVVIEQSVSVAESDTAVVTFSYKLLFLVTGDTVDFDTVIEYVDGLDDTVNYYAFIHREYIEEIDTGMQVITRTTEGFTPADTTGIDMVFMAYSVKLSQSMQVLFRNLDKPIVVSSPSLYPQLAMTGPVEGTDWGIDNEYRIIIMDSQHPIAGGMSGTVFGTNIARMGWGMQSTDGVQIGDAPSPPFHTFLFCYSPGDMMVGTSAPARRVGFFGQETLLAEDGIALLKNCVLWARDGT